MDAFLTDSNGSRLLLTTAVTAVAFDAIACSPHSDGFTVLNSLADGLLSKAQLDSACKQATARQEVCVLPVGASSKGRLLLTPTVQSLNPSSRLAASRLMIDLYNATQSVEVRASTLLITHFAYGSKYPEVHVLGILDALKELASRSFGILGVLGIQFRPEQVPQFEANVRATLAA